MKQFTIRVRIGHGPQKGLLLQGYEGDAVTREMIEERFSPVPRKAYRVTFTLRANGKYHQKDSWMFCIWPEEFQGQRYSRKVW